ncbi:PIN domain-like protein [Ephemerocybe angulata]|uniref:PIN domain-like protein n=1 Tax=Ephemerocybe angulata TaxID=980116 RepID=A0A8H6HC21_9AGAR|nr:PIN domain-like protein [Tulosesus angulatus]
MGINDIWTLAKPAGKRETLSHLALSSLGMRANSSQPMVEKVIVIGIDMGTYMDECVASTKSKGIHSAFAGASALRPFFFRLCALLNKAANFVFVYDGPERPEVKRGKKVQRHRKLWWVKPTQLLIESFGFCIHQAPGEAEAELALLNRWGVVQAIMTADGDALLGSAPIILRTIKAKDRGADDEVTRYDDVTITNDLSFTLSRRLLFALLCGGDYSDRLCGYKSAEAIVLSGVGDNLMDLAKRAQNAAELTQAVASWKQTAHSRALKGDLQLDTRARNSFLSALNRFPTSDAIDLYITPKTSCTHPSYLPDSAAWDMVQQPDVPRLIGACMSQVGWSDAAELLKKLEANALEGFVLRLIYSRRCIWDETTRSFGTSTRRLKIQGSHVEMREAAAIHGEQFVRLELSPAELTKAFELEDLAEEAERGEAATKNVFRVWVQPQFLPEWAQNLGKGARNIGKGRGTSGPSKGGSAKGAREGSSKRHLSKGGTSKAALTGGPLKSLLQAGLSKGSSEKRSPKGCVSKTAVAEASSAQEAVGAAAEVDGNAGAGGGLSKAAGKRKVEEYVLDVVLEIGGDGEVFESEEIVKRRRPNTPPEIINLT